MYLPFLNIFRAINPYNPANAVPLQPASMAPMPVEKAPATVLNIVNQTPTELARRDRNFICSLFYRRAELREMNRKEYSGPNTKLGRIMNTIAEILLYRHHVLRIIDNQGHPIDSQGRRIPRPPRPPPRKFRYTEHKRPSTADSKKTRSLHHRRIARRSVAYLQNPSHTTRLDRMKANGKLAFRLGKNWRQFKQTERFSSRVDYQDMIDRGTTYAYEREKKLFYSDPKNQSKPFYPRFLPIVVSRTKDIDDWRIKTGPNGQMIQPQIVMPSLSQNNNGDNSESMNTDDAATEVDDDADDIAVDNIKELPPLPPRPGVYEFIPMTFRPPRLSGPPFPTLTQLRAGKEVKALQPGVGDLTGWDAARRQIQVWYNPRSTLNIEEGLVPPYAHHEQASRDPPPSPPGYTNPVPAPTSSVTRNQAPSAPSVPLRRLEPVPSTPITSGSGPQQPVTREPLQQVSQTQLPTAQPVSLIPATFTPPSLLSRLSPPDVRWEESSSNEDAGPTAQSTYVEIPTAPNSPEPTVANASFSNIQQPPIQIITPTHGEPASVSNVFRHSAYSSVQQPQIPMASPPSSQDIPSSSINIDNIMGWTTGPELAARTSWASLAAQAPTTSWWGSQAFQQPVNDPPMVVDDQPSNTPPSYSTPFAFADADMGMDAEAVSPAPVTSSPWGVEQPQQPAFEQAPYSSNFPNGTQYQPDAQQNPFLSDQQTSWASAPQTQPNARRLEICCQDNATNAWLPYVDSRLQICVFDPSSQTYIPLQLLMQQTYVGASNRMSDQTQSSSSSMYTSFNSYQQNSTEEQQHQSPLSSMHTIYFPPQQRAPGPEQQSSPSSMYASSYPSEQCIPGIQQQNPMSSMPTSSTTFAPLQFQYPSSHPVEVVQPQQPSLWNQPLVDPGVAATLAAYNSWGSMTGTVRRQDPPVATFDATHAPTVAPSGGPWYQSEVDSSVAALQTEYKSGESTSEFGYQDPYIPDANFFQVSVDPQEIPEVEVELEKEPWEASTHSAAEDDLRRNPVPLYTETETARRQGVHPPAIRLRRLKYRRNELPRVNDALFDAQVCRQHRINERNFGKQENQPRESQTSSTPRSSQKKRSCDESESTKRSSRRRILDDGSIPIRPPKRARHTESPVEPLKLSSRKHSHDVSESSAKASHVRSDNEGEGTQPTRSSKRARRSDLPPDTHSIGQVRFWANPVTASEHSASSSRLVIRPSPRKQKNAASSKSDRICPFLPCLASWFNADETRS